MCTVDWEQSEAVTMLFSGLLLLHQVVLCPYLSLFSTLTDLMHQNRDLEINLQRGKGKGW